MMNGMSGDKVLSEYIKSEDLRRFLDIQNKSAAHNIPEGREILPGEIEGLKTVFYAVGPGESLRSKTSEQEGRVYLFTAGSGIVDDGENSHEVNEIAFFAPRHNAPFTTRATRAPLVFLELIVALSETDRTELNDGADQFPIFLSYSDCKTYRERIKSEKTVSRTLLPEYTFPRLCIGSVETTGPDAVAAHEHPMLEQLFFGLQDNDCILTADEAQVEFKEGVLLHIPLGSRHGVVVKESKKLHYIWIDLFKERKGMEWIVQEHIEE